MPSVNVLYQSDDNYAGYMGVSLYSMLKNNEDEAELNVVIIDDHISEGNKRNLTEVAESFGRSIVWFDSEQIRQETLASKWLKYNGFRKNTNCYLKYFIMGKLRDMGMDRIMYIDSDSIVVGHIGDLFTMDMQGKAIGMTRCCLVTESYRKEIGFGIEDPYYNAGMNLFDVFAWVERGYPEKLIENANNGRVYSTVDQDLLNFTLRGDVLDIGCKYNYQCMHRAFPFRKYSRSYRPFLYYDEQHMKDATEDCRIVHFMRFCGQYPWDKRTHHPSRDEYESYRAETPWEQDDEYPSKNSAMVFRIERMLYVVLPGGLYLRLFRRFHERMLLKNDRKAQCARV